MGNKVGSTQTLHKTVTEILSQLHRLRDELSKVTFAVQREVQSCGTASSNTTVEITKLGDTPVEKPKPSRGPVMKPEARAALDAAVDAAVDAVLKTLQSARPDFFLSAQGFYDIVKPIHGVYKNPLSCSTGIVQLLKRRGVKIQSARDAMKLGCYVPEGSSGYRIEPDKRRIEIEQATKRYFDGVSS